VAGAVLTATLSSDPSIYSTKIGKVRNWTSSNHVASTWSAWLGINAVTGGTLNEATMAGEVKPELYRDKS